MMKMRAEYVPEDCRATIINFFRIPLNLFVCVVLANVRGCLGGGGVCMLWCGAVCVVVWEGVVWGGVCVWGVVNMERCASCMYDQQVTHSGAPISMAAAAAVVLLHICCSIQQCTLSTHHTHMCLCILLYIVVHMPNVCVPSCVRVCVPIIRCMMYVSLLYIVCVLPPRFGHTPWHLYLP